MREEGKRSAVIAFWTVFPSGSPECPIMYLCPSGPWCTVAAMGVATAYHPHRSHCHTFDFNPLLYLPPADAADLETLLLAQRGSVVFKGLRAWRLRLTPKAEKDGRCPWAVEVPLGTFSSFTPGLVDVKDEEEGRERLFASIREYRHTSTDPDTPKRPGRRSTGFSLSRDIFVREGVTYYRENALSELRMYGVNPRLFWALHSLLQAAIKAAHIITGRDYLPDGRLPRPKVFVPFEQRKVVNGRVTRGLAWSKDEDDKLRVFFRSGYVITEAQFLERQREALVHGKVPPQPEALTKWREFLLADLRHQRSMDSIQERVYYLNGLTRQKYELSGRIPASRMADFRAEYLGIPVRGFRVKPRIEHLWMFVLRAQGDGPLFFGTTKVPVLRVSQVIKAAMVPVRAVALAKTTDKAFAALQASLAEHKQLHDWYAPAPLVLTALAEAQSTAVTALTSGEKDYVNEATRLRAHLDWSLLKHVP